MNFPGQTQRGAGFGRMFSAVVASFIGIRRRGDYESDAANLSLRQVIVAGIVGGVVFVIGVILLVKTVLANLVSAG